MELHEYPRPANDTGIGIHWSPDNAAAIGMSKIRQIWIPELKAMGVKWVKIYNHDGAEEFCEHLLEEEFMPIVRIYRSHPNPGRLGVKELVDVDRFVRIGVRYFEFNNEPDRDAEWRGGRVPANGLDIVVEDAIADMEAILERGGMPAVPAVSSGSRWDLVGKIIEKGRRDLFDGPVWQAIHNYSRNRPLDYPYDLGNQEGAAYTQRFYNTLRDEQVGFDPWHGRSLAQINQMRRDYANPGATPRDDTMCWLAYEHMDARNRQHLGRSIPILSTENGYVVGEHLDPRYPATTPALHLAQTLEACRVMMGSSRRFPAAPDYYFCTAFTLIANAKLGSTRNWWEEYAWYSDRWPGGALPIVRALRAEPKVLRRWQNQGQIGTRIALHGTVINAREQLTVILDRNGNEQARVTLDPFHRYRFPDLTPGAYTVRIQDTDVLETITLHADQQEAVLNLEIPATQAGPTESMVRGVVAGGANAVVLLLRGSDGQEWVAMAREDGTFRFVDLPAGTYSARVHPHGTRVDAIVLDGRNEMDIELAVDGWGYTVHHEPTPADRNVLCCIVEGYKDLPVQAHTADWQSDSVETGSAPAHGEFACEIPLPDSTSPQSASEIAPEIEPGEAAPDHAEMYTVVVSGVVDEEGDPVPLRAHVERHPGQMPVVRFLYRKPDTDEPVLHSGVLGRVLGNYAEDAEIHVVLTDEQAHRRSQPIDDAGSFAFAELPAGLYTIAIEGHEETTARSDIALDGKNQVYVELTLPAEKPTATLPPAETDASPASVGHSTIVGHVHGVAGKMATLTDRVGNRFSQPVNEQGQVRFDDLPAGVYTLAVDGGYEQSELEVDGADGLEVYFMPLETKWQCEVSRAGSMPGFSAIRVEVVGVYDLPVYLSQADWDGMVALTGSRADLGEFALEFSPLEPGYYIVEPKGLELVAEVDLAGLEAAWVTFWEETRPLTPNVVVPLGATPPPSSADTEKPSENGENPDHITDTPNPPGVDSMAAEQPDAVPSQADRPDVEPSDPPQQSAENQIHNNPGDRNDRDSDNDPEMEVGFGDASIDDTADDTAPVIGPGLSTGEAPMGGQPSGEPLPQSNIDLTDAEQRSLEEPASIEVSDTGTIGQESLASRTEAAENETADEPEQADRIGSKQYLFINVPSNPAHAQTVQELIAILRYVASVQPEIGADAGAAARAGEVIVVGDVDDATLRKLEAQGAHTEQVSDRIIEAFRCLKEAWRHNDPSQDDVDTQTGDSPRDQH